MNMLLALAVFSVLVLPVAFIVTLVSLVKKDKNAKPAGIICLICLCFIIVGMIVRPFSKNNESSKVEKVVADAPGTEEVAEIQTQEPEPEPKLSKKELQKALEEEVGDSFSIRKLSDDVTGNWRVASVVTPKYITDYAVDYYNAFFESDDEIHIIINFGTKTKNVIRSMYGMLSVSVYEHVENEELSANTLLDSGGYHFAEYLIHLSDGTIDELDPNADD